MQAREITEKALLGGTKIELRNAERGKYFRVVAEVWIDGESLADTLKAKGLAKDYDGGRSEAGVGRVSFKFFIKLISLGLLTDF